MQAALEFFQYNREAYWNRGGDSLMSISNHQQLEHAKSQLARLQFILEEMRNEESIEAYAILSKGYVEQMENIRREIDEYLGFSEIEYRKPAVVASKPFPFLANSKL